MTKTFTSQQLSFEHKKTIKSYKIYFLFIMFNGQINFKSCIFFKGS